MKTRDKRRLLRMLHGHAVLLSPRPLNDAVGDIVPVWVDDTRCWERALLTEVQEDTGVGSIKFAYQICDRRFGL